MPCSASNIWWMLSGCGSAPASVFPVLMDRHCWWGGGIAESIKKLIVNTGKDSGRRNRFDCSHGIGQGERGQFGVNVQQGGFLQVEERAGRPGEFEEGGMSWLGNLGLLHAIRAIEAAKLLIRKEKTCFWVPNLFSQGIADVDPYGTFVDLHT
jgi:hypothetical protein